LGPIPEAFELERFTSSKENLRLIRGGRRLCFCAALSIRFRLFRCSLFLGSGSFSLLVRFPGFYFPRIVDQLDNRKFRSIAIAVLTAIFSSMVMTVQFAVQMSRFGVKEYVSSVVSLSLVRELGPVLTALLVGGRVGAEVYKTLLLIRRGASREIPLDVRSKTWMIKRRLPTPEKVKRAFEVVQAGPRDNATDWTFAKETVLLDAIIKARPEEEVEVQAIQIGPAVFVSNPAEYFVQYGLDIKKSSKFPFTFPVELANGSTGYVPTEEAFGPNGGGYETRLTSYSNLEISAGRQMAEAGIELANQMTPGPIPQPPPAPPFRAPWLYGNQPPELK